MTTGEPAGSTSLTEAISQKRDKEQQRRETARAVALGVLSVTAGGQRLADLSAFVSQLTGITRADVHHTVRWMVTPSQGPARELRYSLDEGYRLNPDHTAGMRDSQAQTFQIGDKTLGQAALANMVGLQLAIDTTSQQLADAQAPYRTDFYGPSSPFSD